MFAFQAGQQGGKQLQISEGLVGSGEDLVQLIFEGEGDECFYDEDEQEGRFYSCFAPDDGSSDCEYG